MHPEMLPGHAQPPSARRGRSCGRAGGILLTDLEAGLLRPGRGWITTGIITAAVAAAGRTHRRNYRDFISKNGLPPLLNARDSRWTSAG